MRQNNAGCLNAVLASFSRLMLLMFWLARPLVMDATFQTILLPCLGFLFLPFTTLMYVLLQTSEVGRSLNGLDWLWLALAVVLDIASVGSAGYTNRSRLPVGTTSDPQGY